ncbi:flagellar hook-length control protein FliK [Microbacterium phosphatis]|uniref:flagellar hook-length control protein FliK n=1 Tax=Microbacterium phosphatis TaxID=3140248 RepID=UPI00314044A8
MTLLTATAPAPATAAATSESTDAPGFAAVLAGLEGGPTAVAGRAPAASAPVDGSDAGEDTDAPQADQGDTAGSAAWGAVIPAGGENAAPVAIPVFASRPAATGPSDAAPAPAEASPAAPDAPDAVAAPSPAAAGAVVPPALSTVLPQGGAAAAAAAAPGTAGAAPLSVVAGRSVPKAVDPAAATTASRPSTTPDESGAEAPTGAPRTALPTITGMPAVPSGLADAAGTRDTRPSTAAPAPVGATATPLQNVPALAGLTLRGGAASAEPEPLPQANGNGTTPPVAAAAPATPTAPSAPAPAASAPAPAAPPLPAQLAPPLLSLARAPQGTHELTLTVTPEDLGPVTVRAHISAEGIRVELVAPSDAGRDAIRLILNDLRRDLAAATPHASLSLAAGDTLSQQGSAQHGSQGGQQAPGQQGSAESQRREQSLPTGPREQPPAAPVPEPHVPHVTPASFDVLA